MKTISVEFTNENFYSETFNCSDKLYRKIIRILKTQDRVDEEDLTELIPLKIGAAKLINAINLENMRQAVSECLSDPWNPNQQAIQEGGWLKFDLENGSFVPEVDFAQYLQNEGYAYDIHNPKAPNYYDIDEDEEGLWQDWYDGLFDEYYSWVCYDLEPDEQIDRCGMNIDISDLGWYIPAPKDNC